MTVPIGAFPTQFNQGTIMDPMGGGMGVAGGLADVLAQMQMQKENQFRMQELQNQMMQQQALQRYYEEQARLGHEQESRLAGENLLAQQKQAAAGRAVSQYFGQPGVFTPTGGGGMSSSSTMPPYQGNMFREITEGAAQAVGGPAGVQAALTGVPDEHKVDALKAIQEAQATMPQAPELPTSAQEFMFMQSLSPEQQKAFLALKHPPRAPGTVVNVGGEPTPYSKSYDDARAKQTESATVAGNKQYLGMAAIDEAHDLLSKGGALTGFGAKQKLAIARVASAMGVPDAEKMVNDTQQLQNLTGQQVFSFLATKDLGSGTAVGVKDLEFAWEQAGRDLTMNKVALQRIMRINYGTAIMKVDDSIAQLRRDAVSYPERRGQLTQEADQLNAKYQLAWKTYARMLKEEGMSDAEIMEKMVFSRVNNPERVLQGLRGVGPNIRQMGDSLFDGLAPVRR